MRTCARCKQEKGDADFYRTQRSYCKSCLKAYVRNKWAAMTPDEKQDAMLAQNVARWNRTHPENRIGQ